MTLTLTLTNVAELENGEATQLRLDRHGAIIGRSPHSDWSLPDPKNYVSSTHCEIDYRAGEYLLIDKSTNGTFLNGAKERMSSAHVLREGDIIGIGHYRVGVSGGGARASAAAPAAGTSALATGGAAGWAGWSSDPAGAPAPAAAASAGWDSAPAGWDRKPEPSGGSGWASEVAPTQAADTGWATPAASGEVASGWGAADTRASSEWNAVDAGAPAPAAGWDATPSPSQGRWQETAASAPVSRAAPPPADSVWGQKGAGPAAPAASGWDAIAPARDTAQEKDGGWTAGGGAITGRGAMAQHWAAPRIDAPEPAAPASEAVDVWGTMAASNTVDWSRGGFGVPLPSASAPAAPLAAPTADAEAWAALLAAAGISSDALNAPPEQAARTAGAILKRLVAGLVVMMEARARAKAQLGAQSTTLELKGNNPIKFARSPERVLAQLLNPPERGFMGATDAVEDSFRDLQAHQMATLAAMQGALRATLDRFSPEAIRKRAEMRGVLARILPGARNATLWEAYEREFEGVAKGSDEAFMDVFAKAFKAAYEQVAAQMKAQGG